MQVLTKSPRYGFIDAVRGISACCVMLQHSLYQSGLLSRGSKEPLTGFIPHLLELGETGVVAFFLVSGFVIPLSLDKTAKLWVFWVHRALRIYPLYVLVYLVTFVLHSGGHIQSFRGFIFNAGAHLLFIQEYVGQEEFVGGSWTLSLELIWYIGLATLFFLSLMNRTNLIVAGSVIVSSVAVSACSFGKHVPMGRLSMLIACVLGLICYRGSRGEITRSQFRLFACVLIITIATNLAVGLAFFPADHPTATFQMAANSWTLAAVIFFVPFLSRDLSLWQNLGFVILGRISYSVYLIHPLVLYYMAKTTVEGVSLVAATFALTLAVSILTYELVEKPSIRWGRSVVGISKKS